MLGYRLAEAGQVVSGVYCTWSFADGRFHLENDQYGLYPVFYSTWGGRLVLSTDIMGLLKAGVPADYDFDALAVLLRLGFHLDCDTVFRHIRRLPPNARISVSGGAFHVDGARPPVPPRFTGSMDEAGPIYGELFGRSMRRILEDAPRFQMPLSGGRDSRHVYLEAVAQGHAPERVLTTKFLPPRSENDVEVVRQLIEGTGIPLLTVDPCRDLFRAGQRHDRLTQYMSWEHVWLLALRDRLVESGLPVFDGLAGDSLSGSTFETARVHDILASGGKAALAQEIIRFWSADLGARDEVIARCLTADFAAELGKERAVSRIVEWLDGHGSRDRLPNFFNFWNRMRNGPGFYTLGVLRDCKVYTPFLDYELYEFLSSLPSKMIAGKEFHTRTISTRFPASAHIPYAASNGRAKGGRWSSALYLGELAARLCIPQPGSPIAAFATVGRAVWHIPKQDFLPQIWWRPRIVQFLHHLHADASRFRHSPPA